MMRTFISALTLASLLFATGVSPKAGAQSAPPPRAQAPKSVRLYVFDCGTLAVADLTRYRMKREEVSTDKLSVGCYLVMHPMGMLIWDTGAVPDAMVKPGPAVAHQLKLLDGQERTVTLGKTLKGQLAEIGVAPADVTYLALSHYHYDHTANTNDFADAVWLVRGNEFEAMFAPKPPDLTLPSTYSTKAGGRTTIISTDEHDVFGDGTVVIKFAPGHTPGHQVLSLKLAKTGRIVLSGDLYHFPEERTLGRVPTFDDDQAQTTETRKALDAYLKKNNAQLWIQHDFAGNAKLKKSPQFYE